MKHELEGEKNPCLRAEWIEKYFKGHVIGADAAQRLGVSLRQFRRLCKGCRKDGIASLFHGLEKRPSNHRHPADFKKNILGLIRKKYYDCGPTLISEYLEEREGIGIHRETLRLWMRDEKLLVKQRKRQPYRSRRERKPCFGEMLQLDGSSHRWFGADGPKDCLISIIDDATSVTASLFDHEETIRCACLLLWQWCKKHGVPLSIYADRRNAYISETLSESNGLFGQMCRNLKIKTIPAFSPQAKGRVERLNATHQDRLPSYLRLEGIANINDANKHLAPYLARHNKLFSTIPQDQADAHRKLPKNSSLDSVCFIETTRKVQNDWTIKLDAVVYQIKRRNYCPAKSTVHVRKTFSGNVQIFFKNQLLAYVTISKPNTSG